MPLEPATLAPLIALWSAALATPWTAAEKDAVAARLGTIAGHLVPHRVDDVALTELRWQAFLLRRTLAAVEAPLVTAAAGLRRYYRITPPKRRADGAGPAIGLQSATRAELDTLPGIGAARAEDIARYLARHPRPDGMAELTAIPGIGPETVEGLADAAYLEPAVPMIVIDGLADFAEAPGIPALLRLLETGDAHVFTGDHTTRLRRGAPGGTPAVRFLAFLDDVAERAGRAAAPAEGVLASDAAAELDRGALHAALRQQMHPAPGTLLVNAAYAVAVRAALEAAQTRVDLMMFVATGSAGVDGAPGPKDLVEALLAANARGVAVRVILDQDDDGYPYNSAHINAGLFNQLKAAGIAVKFDEKDVLLHSKLCVIDGVTVFVGAHNWTRAGIFGIHDLSVGLESPALAQDYAARFEAVWAALPG